MANNHLKTALTRASLTVEEFADIITVDPKTVQRWVAGRVPYPRHRATISRALDIPEHELWPDAVSAPAEPDPHRPAALGGVPDVVGAWGDPGADGAPNPVALLTSDVHLVDLLDPDGTLLATPGVAGALQTLAASGARIRTITHSFAFEPADADRDRAQVRSPAIPYPNLIVLRVDAAVLLALPLHDGAAPPVMTLQDGKDGLFDRLGRMFDANWNAASAHESEPEILQAVADNDPASGASEPPRRWPRRSD